VGSTPTSGTKIKELKTLYSMFRKMA